VLLLDEALPVKRIAAAADSQLPRKTLQLVEHLPNSSDFNSFEALVNISESTLRSVEQDVKENGSCYVDDVIELIPRRLSFNCTF